MATYYGVVHNRRIELEGGASLAEGTRVEVRTQSPAKTAADDEAVKARLRAAGVLAPQPLAAATDQREDEEFEPVEVQGEPLSEQLLRERR